MTLHSFTFIVAFDRILSLFLSVLKEDRLLRAELNLGEIPKQNNVIVVLFQ